MNFAAYEVAIKLNLVGGLSKAMGLVSASLIKANTHATDLQKRLDSIASKFKTGAIMTGAGFGLAMVMKAATNEAVKYEQQMNRLKALNLGAGQNSSLTNMAQSISSKTKGTSQLEALRLVTETQAITGNSAHTADLAPLLAKMRFGMETYMAAGGKGEGHGATASRQFADIVKVMEMRGLMRNFSEEKMAGMADLFTKSYVASGGQVKPSDFLAMMKTGGVAAKSTSDDFMFALGHIMQEKGGHRSGTALMSMYQNLVAGRMPQQIAETLKGLNLLDPSAIHYGKTGHITKVDPGGVKNSALLLSRPDLYMEQMIMPALQKQGVNIADQQSVLMKLNSMAGQRTAADLLAQLFLEKGQIANYMAQAKNSMGVNQLYDQSANSTVGKQIDLQAKLNNLEKTFGEAILPIQIKLYEKLIPLVEQFGSLLERHPHLLHAVVYGLGALAASLLITGPLMMLTSGFKAARLAMDILGGAGGSLAKLATGLSMVTKACGIFMAAYIGWEVGGWLNNHVVNPAVQKLTGDKNQTLGGWAYDFTHQSWGFGGSSAMGRGESYVRPGAKNGQQVQVYNTFDANGITTKVAGGIGSIMSKSMSGGGIDYSLVAPMPSVK